MNILPKLLAVLMVIVAFLLQSFYKITFLLCLTSWIRTLETLIWVGFGWNQGIICHSNLQISESLRKYLSDSFFESNCDDPMQSIMEVKMADFVRPDKIAKISQQDTIPYIVRDLIPNIPVLSDILDLTSDVSLRCMNITSYYNSTTALDCPQKRKDHAMNLTLNEYYQVMKENPNDELYIPFSVDIYSNRKALKFVASLYKYIPVFAGKPKTEAFIRYSNHNSPQPSTLLHSNIHENYFFQIFGEKQWDLIAPRYGGAVGATYGGLELGEFPAYMSSPRGLFFNSRKLCIPWLRGIIRPGDMLFIPSWYFHEVTNLNAGWNLGFSTRHLFSDQKHPLFIHICRIFQWIGGLFGMQVFHVPDNVQESQFSTQ